MSASRKRHLTEARAHSRSRKQSAKAKARQSHKHETPRSQRIPASKQMPIVFNPFAQFLAANYRKAAWMGNKMISTWRGFIPESKSFMAYDKMSLRRRIWFWFEVPFAYIRYRRAA